MSSSGTPPQGGQQGWGEGTGPGHQGGRPGGMGQSWQEGGQPAGPSGGQPHAQGATPQPGQHGAPYGGQQGAAPQQGQYGSQPGPAPQQQGQPGQYGGQQGAPYGQGQHGGHPGTSSGGGAAALTKDLLSMLGLGAAGLGLLHLIAMAMSWASIDFMGSSMTLSGYKLMNEGGDDGSGFKRALFTMLFSIVLIGIGAAMVFVRQAAARLGLAISIAVIGLLLLIFTGTTLGDLPDGVDTGFGLILNLLLSLATIGLGVFAAITAKKAAGPKTTGPGMYDGGPTPQPENNRGTFGTFGGMSG